MTSFVFMLLKFVDVLLQYSVYHTRDLHSRFHFLEKIENTYSPHYCRSFFASGSSIMPLMSSSEIDSSFVENRQKGTNLRTGINLRDSLPALLMGLWEPYRKPPDEFHCNFDIFQSSSPFSSIYHQGSQNYANLTTTGELFLYCWQLTSTVVESCTTQCSIKQM